MTDDIDDYAGKLLAIMRDARDFGIDGYLILHTRDPIASTSSTRYVCTADHVLAMGMLAAAQLYTQDEYINPEEDDDEDG